MRRPRRLTRRRRERLAFVNQLPRREVLLLRLGLFMPISTFICDVKGHICCLEGDPDVGDCALDPECLESIDINEHHHSHLPLEY